MNNDDGPNDSVLRRIEGFAQTHHDSGYERGYVDAYRHVRKLLARRSLAYLLVGLLLGGMIIFLLAENGVIGAEQKPQDPIDLGMEKGRRFQATASFANTYSVGIRVNFNGAQFTTGSGFIFDDLGHIVTNSHVVDDQDASRSEIESITVFWKDRQYEAELVGANPITDVAVIRFAAKGAKAAPTVESERDWVVAEEVLAIGSPFDLRYTVTSGIISHPGRHLNRRVVETPNGPARQEHRIPYIQTDCAINSGNSGGPLVNLQGRVIGMNSLIFSRSDSFAGVGFAIPIHVVRREANKIIGRNHPPAGGYELVDLGQSSEIGFLGIIIDPKTLDKAIVAHVFAYSAAERAGIRVGDRIVKVGEKDVDTRGQDAFTALKSIIEKFKPGDRVKMIIEREDPDHVRRLKETTVELGGKDR